MMVLPEPRTPGPMHFFGLSVSLAMGTICKNYERMTNLLSGAVLLAAGGNRTGHAMLTSGWDRRVDTSGCSHRRLDCVGRIRAEPYPEYGRYAITLLVEPRCPTCNS